MTVAVECVDISGIEDIMKVGTEVNIINKEVEEVERGDVTFGDKDKKVLETSVGEDGVGETARLMKDISSPLPTVSPLPRAAAENTMNSNVLALPQYDAYCTAYQ